MIIAFNNAYLQKVFEGRNLPGKPRYAQEVIGKFKKTVLMLKNAENISELRKFRGLNFEALKGKFKGYYSVRVDYHYRLIVSVGLDNQALMITEILVIEDLTNHYQ